MPVCWFMADHGTVWLTGRTFFTAIDPAAAFLGFAVFTFNDDNSGFFFSTRFTFVDLEKIVNIYFQRNRLQARIPNNAYCLTDFVGVGFTSTPSKGSFSMLPTGLGVGFKTRFGFTFFFAFAAELGSCASRIFFGPGFRGNGTVFGVDLLVAVASEVLLFNLPSNVFVTTVVPLGFSDFFWAPKTTRLTFEISLILIDFYGNAICCRKFCV